MTDWSKLKVVDLKIELKKRGLAQVGLKPALVARLTAAENPDGSESEATVQDDTIGKHEASSEASPDAASPVLPSPGQGSDLATDLPAPPISEAPIESVDVITAGDNSPRSPSQTKNIDTGSAPVTSESPEGKDSYNSALPSIAPSEAGEDRQKRKRRSQSPSLSATDVSRKRIRQEDEIVQDQEELNTTRSDAVWVEKNEAADATKADAEAVAGTVDRDGVETGPTAVDVSMEIEKVGAPSEEDFVASKPTEIEATTGDARDSRFKDLFSPEKSNAPVSTVSKSAEGPDAMEVEHDRDISPAIHPATAALYIRDFMRPLNPAQLKSHLIKLATPPGNDIVPDVIHSFFLDPIRTHAFALFANTSTAARVRNALHGQIWPDEKTRKPLWIDFIPVDKVEMWIDQEEATKQGGRSQLKKWEVDYFVDEDRFVTASLQEVTNVPRTSQNLRQSSASNISVPISPKNEVLIPTGPREPHFHQQRATNLGKLDELFKSTTTKPVLYYQPVSKDLAHSRLDSIDRAMSKDAAAGRRIVGDIHRYTFEDRDVLVNRGPEIFSGIRPPPGYRPRGGSSRGGYQSRGGFSGAQDRRYDSYRANQRDPRDDRW